MGTLTEMQAFCTTRRGLFTRNIGLIAAMVSWLSAGLAAEDRLQEQDWARQLQREAPAAQRNWLGKENNQFFALYLAATRAPAGGVIVLHDAGGHPDHGLVAPLRRHLASAGWNTLSIQLPLADSTRPSDFPSLLPTAYERLNAAIDFLHGKQNSIIVIIGYGYGAWVAVNFLSTQKKSQDDIAGLALISLPTWVGLDAALDSTPLLASLSLPRLDVYAEMDTPEVLRHTQRRVEAVRQASSSATSRDAPSFSIHSLQAESLARRKYGASGYRQRKIAATDHSYGQQTRALNSAVSGWLKAYWRPIERNVDPKKPQQKNP